MEMVSQTWPSPIVAQMMFGCCWAKVMGLSSQHPVLRLAPNLPLSPWLTSTEMVSQT